MGETKKATENGKEMVESAVVGAVAVLLLLALRHFLVSPPSLFLLLHFIVGSILFTSTRRSSSPDNLPDQKDDIAAGDDGGGGGGGGGGARCGIGSILKEDNEAHQQLSAEEVNAKVEAFIGRFKQQLVLQKGIDAEGRTRRSSCYGLPLLVNDTRTQHACYKSNKIRTADRIF